MLLLSSHIIAFLLHLFLLFITLTSLMLDFYFEMHRHTPPRPTPHPVIECRRLLWCCNSFGENYPLDRVRRAESFKGHSHKSCSPPSVLFALWLRCVGHRCAPAPFLLGGPFGLPFWQQKRALSFARDGAPRLILSKHPQVPVPLLLQAVLAEAAGHSAGRVGVPGASMSLG